VAHHFAAVAAHQYDSALADYGEEFFAKVSREEWPKTLAQVEAKLGTFQKYEVAGWHMKSQFGTSGSGTRVELECRVAYARYAAEEKFVLFRTDDDQPFQIVKHGISSEGLSKE
jgi:hypothetical protein